MVSLLAFWVKWALALLWAPQALASVESSSVPGSTASVVTARVLPIAPPRFDDHLAPDRFGGVLHHVVVSSQLPESHSSSLFWPVSASPTAPSSAARMFTASISASTAPPNPRLFGYLNPLNFQPNRNISDPFDTCIQSDPGVNPTTSLPNTAIEDPGASPTATAIRTPTEVPQSPAVRLLVPMIEASLGVLAATIWTSFNCLGY